MLLSLARQPGVALSRERILLDVWRTTWSGKHTLEVHVASLRGKLGDPIWWRRSAASVTVCARNGGGAVRNRLVGTYVLLLCMVLVALEVPFAIALSNRETERVVADRLADATRFASLAAPALRSGELESLKDELRSYYTLYGIATMLVDQDQRVLSVFGAR